MSSTHRSHNSHRSDVNNANARNFVTSFVCQSTISNSQAAIRRVGFLLAAAFSLVMMSASASATTYYSVASLPPNSLASWNTQRDGLGTPPLSFITAGDIFVVQGTGNGGTSPHSMTTTAVWTVGAAGSRLQIESGGSLQADHAITIGSATATFQIDSGATYTQNNLGSPSGTIYSGVESFGATSNFVIRLWGTGATSSTTGLTTGLTASIPSGGNSYFYGNLTINTTAFTGAFSPSLANPTRLCAGDLAVNSTGAGASAIFRFTTGATAATIFVLGSYTQATGTKVDYNNGTATTTTLSLGGNFTLSGTASLDCSGSGFGAVSFVKSSGTQTVDVSSTAVQPWMLWTVGDGTTTNTVQLLNSINATGTTGRRVGTVTINANAVLDLNGFILRIEGSTTGNVAIAGTLQGTAASSRLLFSSSGTSTTTLSGAGTVNGGNLTVEYNHTSATSVNLISRNLSIFALTITNGFVRLNNTATLRTINLTNFSMALGTLDTGSVDVTGNVTAIVNLTGNFSKTGGSVTNNSPSGIGAFVFNGGGGAQTWANTGTFQFAVNSVTTNSILTLNTAMAFSGVTGPLLTIDLGSTVTAGTQLISTSSTSGNFTVNGTIQTANANGVSGAANTTFVSTNAPTLTLGANSTVEYNSAAAQNITALNYANLTSSSTGARTLPSGSTVRIAKVFTPGTNAYTITGSTVEYNGTTAQVLPSGFTTYNNLTLNNAAGTTGFAGLTVNGLIRVQAGTFTSSSTYNNVQIDSGATLAATPGSTINVSGDWTNNGGTFTPSTGTVNFNNTSTNQSITGTSATHTFNILTVNKTGNTLTFGGAATTVNLSDLTINAGVFAAGTVTAINISGNWTNDAAFTPASSTVTFNGSSNQNVGGIGTNGFFGLTMNGSGGATLTANASVSGVLTLTNGKITTGAFTLSMGSGATSTGASGASYVIGSQKKTYSGAGTFTFDVGTTNGYSPVETNVTDGTGDLTVKATETAQTVLNPATSLQRYWTLTEGGAGITADLTFHYLESDATGFGTESNYRLVIVESGNATNFPENCPDVACVDEAANTIRRTGVTTFSDWTAAEPAAPTAVKLTGFSATRYENGAVELNWQSGFEARNLGYNIYREENGKRTALTSSLIAGSALMAGAHTQLTAGLSYTWTDGGQEAGSRRQEAGGRRQVAGVTYWLEDVDLDGTRSMHGPIAVSDCASIKSGCKEHGERSRLLNELSTQNSKLSTDSGVQISGGPAAVTAPDPGDPEPDPTVMQRTIAGLPGLKLSVSRAGWYRLTQPQVLAAGFNIADANGLQLYRDGRQVAFRLSNNTEQFGPSDYLEFYGEGLSSTTASAQTYYLVKLAEAGKRIELKEKAVGPGDRVSPQGFAYTVERKERLIYFSSLLNGDQENFFGQVVSPTAANATIPVSHLDLAAQSAGSLPQLEVVLQGVTSEAHQVRVRVNGTDLGTMSFANTEHPSQTFTVPAGAVHDGTNTVELTALGGAADTSLIDVLRLTYVRSYEADNNALAFNLSSRQTKRITGFTSEHVRVVDVSDPYNVLELTPDVAADGAGYAALIGVDKEVRAPFSRPHELLAFADGDASAVDAIHANEASSWWTETAGADYLIVTTGELQASLAPLAQLRASQGLVVKVVDVEDLYDENSFGEHSPQAIRDFLAKANTDWTRKPHYVVFAGDASYDPKDYFGQGEADLVPTKLIDTTLTETASDDWLVDFNSDGIADLAIGRLPVRTADQMGLLVNKIASYENAVPDPSRGAVLVSDTGFESPNSIVQGLLPSGMTVTTINRSAADDATVHNQIITGLNQGPLVANYVGHGSNGVWTGASLLSNGDAPGLTNTNRLSVFSMMTCYNGYFQNAFNDSLAEALLKSQGGAVAVWASTTLTDPAGQNAIDQEFYRQLFGAQPATVGDAARAAKFVTADQNVRRTWTLFGDPAMRLR